jgi:hypothetical protein
MDNNDKKDFGSIIEAISEINLKEDLYDKMPKDKLIDRLIMCEMELEARDNEAAEHSIELWYFVSDDTGAKFLTDEEPKPYFIDVNEKLPDTLGKETFAVITKKVLLTDGEINIRVPKKMESMFPEIKCGDEPIKVKLSNVTV